LLFRNLEKLDLAPFSHDSDGRLRPREIKLLSSVLISGGNEENKYLCVLIPSARVGRQGRQNTAGNAPFIL
jgi:hypothetical protein